jgi:hypothetical protein
MGLNIPESGILLESSASAMAGLPAQAFAITLSGSAIEDMIACVQNGGDIQLALGSNPVSVAAPAFLLHCYCLLLCSSWLPSTIATTADTGCVSRIALLLALSLKTFL